MKHVFSQQRYEADGIKQLLQDGNREWVITIAYICTDDNSLTPKLIYQAPLARFKTAGYKILTLKSTTPSL